MTGRAKLMMRQYRPLMIILVITLVIWTAWAMSESQTYSTQVRVEMVGVDTACYAIISRDSVIELDITSNGYRALTRYFDMRFSPVVVDMSKGKVQPGHASISMHSVISAVRSQFDIPSNIPISSSLDSIKVYYSPREKKGFVPVLGQVDFEFSDGYGLIGEPYLLEDSIWLYGSSESLSKINQISTESAHFRRIRSTDTLRIPIKAAWEKYPDLRVSQPYVSLVVPSGAFYEQEMVLPVSAHTADTSLHLRLYPDKVKVLLLSPNLEDEEELSEDQFQCRVAIDPEHDYAPVRVTRFPGQVRIKKIEPENVQYVIIK
ncbi:MAG: hypothetical protein MJZ51_02205 [Bacteroidales bacterium]|nr:hypothetical protein [Bacteroidales bacterium]